MEELDRFGCLDLLSSAEHERFNVGTKRAYRSTLQSGVTDFEETLSDIDIYTGNRRRELHKSEMSMRSDVSKNLLVRLPRVHHSSGMVPNQQCIA